MSAPTAVVMGGGSGIGAATVGVLVEAGARVVVVDRDDSAAREVAGRFGDAAHPVTADVTIEDDVAAAVRAAVEVFGGLRWAVNAAGVSGTPDRVSACDAESWRRTIDVNLTGVFLCLKHQLAAMRSAPAGTAIVNVSSSAGLMGVPGLADYCASKWGVLGLTRAAALEVARSGTRVNAVCPGTTRTPMLEGFAGGADGAASLGAMSPLGRLAEPIEIAAVIAFLLSDAAAYLTGAVVPVDGGVAAT